MRSSVRPVVLKNLMAIKRSNGKVDWYYRKRGCSLVRMPDLPHHDPKFLKEYAAAAEASPKRRRAAVGSLARLIEEAVASDRFKARSDVYRSTLRRHFDEIREKAGTAPAKQLRDRHVRSDVERAANAVDRRKAWRFLCAFGVATGHLDLDPSLTVPMPYRRNTEGFPPWTDVEIEAFRSRWQIGTTKRAAFELLFWTGLRIGDAVKIGRGHVDKRGALVHTQSKVKKPAFVPWYAVLPERLAHLEDDRKTMHTALEATGTNHMTFLATAGGAPRSEKGLGNMIREAARSAGVERSAHGLRKSRGIALAEAGLSAHGIMSWLGHQTLKEAQHYTEEADRWRAVMGMDEEQKLQPAAREVATRQKKLSI